MLGLLFFLYVCLLKLNKHIQYYCISPFFFKCAFDIKVRCHRQTTALRPMPISMGLLITCIELWLELLYFGALPKICIRVFLAVWHLQRLRCRKDTGKSKGVPYLSIYSSCRDFNCSASYLYLYLEPRYL